MLEENDGMMGNRMNEAGWDLSNLLHYNVSKYSYIVGQAKWDEYLELSQRSPRQVLGRIQESTVFSNDGP